MTSTNLDAFDRKILKELQADGRLTLQELSARVGLSASPIARRIKILEDGDVIRGYSALIDEAKLGYGTSVFVSVRLDKQIDGALLQFEQAIAAFPEVVDCWLMTGNRDYLLRVATAGMSNFEQFLTGRLTRIPGVASIESSIPLRRVKSGIARTV